MTCATLGSEAAAFERLGVDGLWSYETAHDPFLPLFAAALATERVSLGTAIAVAFARTPFAMAQTAWDLQRVSGGRLLLGLGTQVRAHVERRFSAEFEHPAARITDYIRCLRAIWDTFQNGARPAYEGRFYRFTLISDFFNPGPIAHPDDQGLARRRRRAHGARGRRGRRRLPRAPAAQPGLSARRGAARDRRGRPRRGPRSGGGRAHRLGVHRHAARARPSAPRPRAMPAGRSPSTPRRRATGRSSPITAARRWGRS